jgi:hypothetical protein
MGMSDNDVAPPSEGAWAWASRSREFFQTYAKGIRTAEFALAATFAGGAWFAGGEMFLVIPGLVLSWLFATVGVVSSNLSRNWVLAWSIAAFAILAGEGGALYWHFHIQQEPVVTTGPPPKEQTPVVTLPPLELYAYCQRRNMPPITPSDGRIYLVDPY